MLKILLNFCACGMHDMAYYLKCIMLYVLQNLHRVCNMQLSVLLCIMQRASNKVRKKETEKKIRKIGLANIIYNLQAFCDWTLLLLDFRKDQTSFYIVSGNI